MQYSDTYLQEVLPPSDPPSEEVPPAVLAELDQLRADEARLSELPQVYQRSVRWTYAIFGQLRLGNYIWETLDGSVATNSPVQVGLFDPKHEGSGYGLIFAAAPNKLQPTPRQIGTIRFPRLNRSFPAMARMVFTILHAPARPWNANSACWARDAATPQTWGFLTSGHAVSLFAPGDAVPLASGDAGILKFCRYPPVDAAFIATAAPKRPKVPTCRTRP